MMTMLQPKQLVKIEKYPNADYGSSTRKDVIDQVRASLAQDGCAVLSNFLSDTGLKAILGEALPCREGAYFSEHNRTNAYLSISDTSYPDTHPVNIMMDRTNGFITADNFSSESLSYRLYHWQSLMDFLAECLEKDELHIYADPVSNMIVNVGPPNTQFNWHYDTNEFTITMLLNPASSGGYFEYVPNIRNANDENYDEVAKVLNGGRKK